MDERQTKIVAGAGLEESRLNTDFIDFLKKWGSHLLLIVAGVAAAYTALGWWERQKAAQLDEAYAQLSAAQIAGQPDNLLRVAEEYSNQGAVSELATIAAGNAFLTAGWSGVAPGGDPMSEDDRLTDEERVANYKRAKELFGQVVAKVADKPKYALHLLDAKFGYAAACASLGEVDAAETTLQETATIARERQYPALADMAEEKILALALVSSMPPLYTDEQVKDSVRRSSTEVDLSFPMPVGPAVPGVDAPQPQPEPEITPTDGGEPAPG